MPHAICLSADARVLAYDRSRPQPIETPWIEVTPAQFATAQGMADPRWTGADVVDAPPPPPTLDTIKAAAIETNQAECERRILAVWPEKQQLNAANGILSAELTEACVAWVKGHRDAENAAADLIALAINAETVAAVKEPVWP